MLYSFQEQLSKGKEQEARLDAYFGQWFDIAKATPQQQRQGIDRILAGRQSGRTKAIEYKADWRAASTGNAWLEMRTANSRGWALKCKADLLAYFLPTTGQLFVADVRQMQRQITTWLHACQTRQVHDRGWTATGLLVPLQMFQSVCPVCTNIEKETTQCTTH